MNVWSIVRRHRVLLLGGVGLGLLGAAASLAQPLLVGTLIEAATAGDALAWTVALTAGLFCADAALAALETYLVGRAGENIVLDVRHALIRRLLRADMAAFSRLDHGDVLTRMVTDTSVARIAVAQSVSQISASALMVVGGIALMAWIDLVLLLVTLGCLGGATVVALLLARQVRLAAVRNRDDTAGLASGIQRVLGALTTIKASRAEPREQERIGALAQRAMRSGQRVTGYSALLTPTINMGIQVSLTVVIGLGMTRVATGALPVAELTSFVMYLFYLVSPLVMMFMAIGQFQQGRAAVDRIRALGTLEQEPHGTPSSGAAPVFAGAGDAAVEFEGVNFSYGPDSDGSRPALRDVSFTVPARGLTAIVGPSGAGKTTLFQLIERFYGPDSGTVRLGGVDVLSLPLERVRDLVGYVEQDSAVMRGTLRENLTYARPEAGDADIERAVRLAGLTEVVGLLPQGLETPLGERGAGLSGGQRQRLAIARTLLQMPRVVLLDEATAHLDTDAETELSKSITHVAEHGAVLAIAHRISTVRAARHVVLLENGGVRATGSHAELVELDALYRRLVAHQFAPSATLEAGSTEAIREGAR